MAGSNTGIKTHEMVPGTDTPVNQTGSAMGTGTKKKRAGDVNLISASGLKMRVRVNSGDSAIIYVGFASPGVATSAASWQITRYDTAPTSTSGDVDGDYPNGDTGFVHIFDNRESLSYS